MNRKELNLPFVHLLSKTHRTLHQQGRMVLQQREKKCQGIIDEIKAFLEKIGYTVEIGKKTVQHSNIKLMIDVYGIILNVRPDYPLTALKSHYSFVPEFVTRSIKLSVRNEEENNDLKKLLEK